MIIGMTKRQRDKALSVNRSPDSRSDTGELITILENNRKSIYTYLVLDQCRMYHQHKSGVGMIVAMSRVIVLLGRQLMNWL